MQQQHTLAWFACHAVLICSRSSSRSSCCRLAAQRPPPSPLPGLPITYSDNTWTFNSCEFADFDGWADAANARLRAQGVPVDTYKYK